MAIIDEVCALRGCQVELAIRAPEDPPRRFGEVVEASSSSSSEIVQAPSTLCQRLKNQEQMLAVQGKMLARINKRLESRGARLAPIGSSWPLLAPHDLSTLFRNRGNVYQRMHQNSRNLRFRSLSPLLWHLECCGSNTFPSA